MEVEIVLQLMFIALGMVTFSLLLNKILGLKMGLFKELRDKSLNLQERMKNAQAVGDPQMMQEVQNELRMLLQQMLKKQLAPMGIRCIIFMGIFIILGIIYSAYEYWFLIYFLFSLLFSFSAMGLKKLYKNVTGKEDKKKAMLRDLMGSVSPAQFGVQPQQALIGQWQSKIQSEEELPEKEDSWKDRIKTED